MGIQSIPQLIEMTDDQKFREVLKDQMAEYQTIASTAEIMLAQRKEKPEEIGATSLAEKLLATAEHNVSEMKKFL